MHAMSTVIDAAEVSMQARPVGKASAGKAKRSQTGDLVMAYKKLAMCRQHP